MLGPDEYNMPIVTQQMHARGVKLHGGELAHLMWCFGLDYRMPKENSIIADAATERKKWSLDRFRDVIVPENSTCGSTRRTRQ